MYCTLKCWNCCRLSNRFWEILENIDLDDNVRLRCSELKSMGFKIALDDHVYAPEHSAFYKMVDIVKVDIMATDPLELPNIAANLRKFPVQLLAERVETVEVFEQCLKYGLSCFGATSLNDRSLSAESFGLTLPYRHDAKLLQQLNDDWDIDEVEETFT